MSDVGTWPTRVSLGLFVIHTHIHTPVVFLAVVQSTASDGRLIHADVARLESETHRGAIIFRSGSVGSCLYCVSLSRIQLVKSQIRL